MNPPRVSYLLRAAGSLYHSLLRKLARRPLNLFTSSSSSSSIFFSILNRLVNLQHTGAWGYYSGEIKRELSACLSAWVSILESNCVSLSIRVVLVTYVSNSTEWKLPGPRDIEKQSSLCEVWCVQLNFFDAKPYTQSFTLCASDIFLTRCTANCWSITYTISFIVCFCVA